MPPGIGSATSQPVPVTPVLTPTVAMPQTGTGTIGSTAGIRQATSPAVDAAANLPTTGDVRTANAQRQPAPNVGLFGHIKSGLTAFKNAITQAFTRPPAPPPVTIPDRVNVSLGSGGQAVLQKAQFEPMIMALPKSERAGAIQNLPATLQARINHGLEVLNAVRMEENQPPATPDNVSDLMLAFYAMAAQKGDSFTNGSFSVPDENGTIAKWLDTSADVYVRSSSHLHAYQGATVDGHLNLQRGIDIQEGAAHGLPNGHRTVLYGTIPDAGHGRRLFLKTESAGCRINTASSGDIQRAVNQQAGMRIRDKRLSDVGEFFRHAFSFIATRGQQGISGARKEHFPKAVSDSYKGVTAELGKMAKAQGPNSDAARVLERLTRGGPAKGGGVCMLLRNIEGVRSEFPGQFTDKLDALEGAVRAMEHNDNLEIRLGNEVILHF